MKIKYHFLLAAGFTLGQSLAADGQSLPPAYQPAPLVNQYRFTPKQPLGSIWQPLPAPAYNLDAPRQATGTIHVDQGASGLTVKPRLIFPPELPGVNYNDLLRDGNGHLRVPSLPPGYTSSGSRPGAIHILRPDKMRCLVPDLARVEHMPVRRMNNADPINRLSPPK